MDADGLALAQPSVLVNGFIGQNAFLTSGFFLAGLHLLKTRPLAAGAVLGLLAIKPQLAVMLPVAMVAGRHWQAIAGGALSALLLLLVGLATLGSASHAAFFDMLSIYAGFVAQGRWPWRELASVYALLRYFGLAAGIAMAIHVAVAAVAAVLVWRSWRHDTPGKEAVLAAATLLATPYLLTYDGVLLGLTRGMVAADRKPHRRLPDLGTLSPVGRCDRRLLRTSELAFTWSGRCTGCLLRSAAGKEGAGASQRRRLLLTV